jgi:prepilin-type N-terminal cleavage/methylation domain-containing protein
VSAIQSRRTGFTLIELLIVVAIIAILAAIAVPNFLEAQTRAKVARCKSDMRTITLGLEAYYTDNNRYPTDAGNGSGGGTYRPYGDGRTPSANFSLGYEITTPVAYLSDVSALRDVFKTQRTYTGAVAGREVYNFACWWHRIRRDTNPTRLAAYPGVIIRDGQWILMGAGPDQAVNNLPGSKVDFSDGAIPQGVNYDPTNGTISAGDIYRTQKLGDRMIVLK